MKSKQQVERYLSNKCFNTQNDLALIAPICSQYYHMDILKTSSEKSGKVGISCMDFMSWFQSDKEAGDVVSWEDKTGIVYNWNPESVVICFRIDRNGPKNDFLTVPIQVIQPSDESASEAIYEALKEKCLEFNRMILEISEKYIPRTGDMVSFTRSDGESSVKPGYGIVRSVAEEDVVMYCCVTGNDEVRYGMDEHIGRLDDYQFSRISSESYGRKKLEERLNASGKSWNHSMKRIEPFRMRAEKGKPYYYMTDKLVVRTGIEDGKLNTAAHKRYLAGNYSRSREVLMEAQTEVGEVLKRIMAKPGV